MGAPHVHAELSAKRFGGKPEDYMPIHDLMDSSKKAYSDLRHRALTHNSWFVTEILEKIFGPTITNSDNKKVAVREIGQWHIMEDYNGSFPSAQDFLMNVRFQPWMNNGEGGAVPPSNEGLPPFDKSRLDPSPSIFPVGEEMDALLKAQGSGSPFPKNRSCGGEGRLD